MRAFRARSAAICAAFTVSLTLGTATALAAPPALPLPDTMAAVGDSITQAASTAGGLGVNAPQNSWSTGTAATVNSHYLRLLAAGAPISGRNYNLSVSGAKMAGLAAQMTAAAAYQPDYLTVLIGGNDICTPTEGQMTPVADFRAQFQAAMAALRAGSPDTQVYVASIPRVMGLWELFKGNWWARIVWSAGGVCQSLLASPTSTTQTNVDRRARVDQRNRDFNAVLAEVCGADARCLWDGGAAFGTPFAPADVSGDYFHPSSTGQAKLAAVSWGAGYGWIVPNAAPTASFTSSCTGLTCTFDDTSTDADGTIVARAWSFGGAGDPQPWTFPAAGSYDVTLSVTDDDGATSTAVATVTVAAAPALTMRIADLSGSRTRVNSSTWRATVTIRVTTPAGAAVSGASVSGGWTVGTPDTCTTGSSGTCSVTSDNLSRSSRPSVTFTVTGATHATHAYVPANNIETSITINRP